MNNSVARALIRVEVGVVIEEEEKLYIHTYVVLPESLFSSPLPESVLATAFPSGIFSSWINIL